MKDLESLRADAALDLHWTPLTRDTHTAVYHAMLNHHRDQLQYLSSKTLPLDALTVRSHIVNLPGALPR